MILEHLSNFLLPFFVIIVCWLALIVIGLPLTLALLPHGRRRIAIPLSPLVAIALIALGYQYWFFLLLQAYRPLIVYGCITLFSLVSFVVSLRLRGELFADVRTDFVNETRRTWPLFLIPLLGLSVFCCFFWANGLELLSAGGDDFFYIQTARVIIEHLFTHDTADFPWGRAEHYLSDFPGHTLAYLPTVRLGAFFLLADISYIFRIVPEKAFPLLMGLGIVVGTSSLAMMQLLIRGSRSGIVASQLALAVSGLLVVLHFQGSLSSMVTLGLRLGGLCYILWAVFHCRTVGPFILAVLLGSSWLLLYHESFAVNLVIPLTVGFAIACLRGMLNFRQKINLVSRLAARYSGLFLSIYALQPTVFMDVVAQHEAYLTKGATNVTYLGIVKAFKSASVFASNRLPAFLGHHSLYDDSAANSYITNALLPYSLLILLILAALASFGFYLRLPRASRYAWTSVPFVIVSITAHAAYRGDAYVMIRSVQMAMPHIFVGLALLAAIWSGPSVLKSFRFSFSFLPRFAHIPPTDGWTVAAFQEEQRQRSAVGLLCSAARVGVFVLWVGVVSLNAFAVVRTISYTNQHSQVTDLLVRHFNPESPSWQQLRNLLVHDDNAPVLLSGFREVRPFMIAIGLGSIPHLAGESIVKIWPDLDPGSFVHDGVSGYNKYSHWLTTQALVDRVKVDPVWNWPAEYDRLLARTRRSIVPVSGAYPTEWGTWPSLFGTIGWRFANLCDVLSRNERAFQVGPDLPPSGFDTSGRFWVLDAPVSIQPELTTAMSVALEIRYDGVAPILMVDGTEVFATTHNIPQRIESVLTTAAVLGPNSVVTIRGTPDTRLRWVGLYKRQDQD